MAGLSIIGGDYAGYECSKCGSTNTTFEEYCIGGFPSTDDSQIGIICDDCEHEATPDEFNERFEQTEPDDVLPDSRGINKQVGDANNG